MTSVETVTYQNLVAKLGTTRLVKHSATDGSKSAGDILKKKLSAGTVTPGGSNAGNGTAGTATVGASAKIGTYTLTCKASAFATAHIPVADLAADADLADIPIFVAPAACELVSVGILAKGNSAGIDAGNTSVFLVEDESSNAIVTKTYSNTVAFPDGTYGSLGTLSATHKILIAGEKVLLSVTNGTNANLPAFDVVIVYKIAGASGATPTFGVVDPFGNVMADLTVGTAYNNGHFTVTISDGSTDFVLGDTFTLAISDSGEVVEADGYGNVLAGVLLEDSDSTSAANYASAMVAGGQLREAAINAPSGLTVAGFKDALLTQLGIELVPTCTL